MTTYCLIIGSSPPKVGHRKPTKVLTNHAACARILGDRTYGRTTPLGRDDYLPAV